jgi:predicted AAA+ superfamily ATPase
MSESIGSDQAAQIRRSSATVLAGDADLGLRLTMLAVCPDCQRAQESRMLGSFVRFMKEAWAHATVILSGSTLRRLFRAHTRYPVGRVRHLVLGPFSFSEFLRALDKTHLAAEMRSANTRIIGQRHELLLSLFDRFLAVGGLPAVVQAYASGDDHGAVRRQIIADYEQDFIRIFGEELIEIVRACFRSVANFAGGVSKNTSVVPSPSSRTNERINQIFARLEGWHLIFRSDQRRSSAQASHNYLPKRYLFDTGVLRELREAAVPAISAAITCGSTA